ncbi:MAG: SUMF1/EgtB/PvdO family nonheme iron enzyme [Verrucomicrobia bacterium]|nr:SUMF1/EgtB/PvdO family nonheme iron enzyme [Verrucomicrobiota bacterium]
MPVSRFALCLCSVLAIVVGYPFPVGDAEETDLVTIISGFALTVPNKTPPAKNAPPGMVWIPGGEFSMGCKLPSVGYCTPATMDAVNDAQPIHRVYVDGFWMDQTDVTNEEFAKFVEANGYVTIAERTPTQEQYPTAAPENLVAGSPVFTPPSKPVPLDNYFQWWRYVPGASWRHPTGPNSDRL